MALHTLDAMLCPCGCGHYSDEAHDDETATRWQVDVVTCHARAALEEFSKAHAKDGYEPGTITTVRLLPEGQTASDPLTYDPARAAEEYEKHMRSLGRLD